MPLLAIVILLPQSYFVIATPYGEDLAYRIAYELAKLGVIIVSGLAYGIDSCAHRGCLDADGITVAVLGTPINQIYPRRNYSLAQKIAERGTILSEYEPGSETKAWHFLQRNRIVSGLGDALLIVEASDHSGTLWTAECALRQGKDIYVVPGDVTRPMSAGCLRLANQGAVLFENMADFVQRFLGSSLSPASIIKQHSSVAEHILRLMKHGLTDGEDLAQRAGLSLAEFLAEMTKLELDGIVKNLGANQWVLC